MNKHSFINYFNIFLLAIIILFNLEEILKECMLF
jgi:hypothetical protein